MADEIARIAERRLERRLAALMTFPVRFLVFAATWLVNVSHGRKIALALAHSRMGRVWERRGRPNKAIARYRRALQINPDCVESRRNLGNVLIAQHKYLNAEVQLEEVLALDPDDPETLASLERLSDHDVPGGDGTKT